MKVLLNLMLNTPDNKTATKIEINGIGIAIIVIIFAILALLLIRLAKDIKEQPTDDKNTKLEHQNNIKQEDNLYKSENQIKTEKKHIPLIIITIIIFGISICFLTKYTSSLDSKETSVRNITTSDYAYTTSQDLSSYQLTIVPKKDFKSCTISLALYNKNDEKLFSDTITKYNLKDNKSYTYTFDFGFINALSGTYIRFNITGECYK